jgi:hypothetical protein
MRKYGLSIDSNISSDGIQKLINSFKSQTAEQSANWANKQNPSAVPRQQLTDLNNLDSDISNREATLHQRRKELNNPLLNTISLQSQLMDKGYRPETVDAAMKLYTNTINQEKAAQEEQIRKQALASVINTLHTTKDPDARNIALIAYDLINGGKNAPDYYKSGLPEQVLQNTDIGNGVAFSMFNKKGTGSDLRCCRGQ